MKNEVKKKDIWNAMFHCQADNILTAKARNKEQPGPEVMYAISDAF